MHVKDVNLEERPVKLFPKVVLQSKQLSLRRNKDARKVSWVILDKIDHQVETLGVGKGAMELHCNVALREVFSLGPQQDSRRKRQPGERYSKRYVVVTHCASSKKLTC